ncbi:MAG TPA: zinc ABC transporter substrate-binding protein [Acidimicrobiales bacterium]|nr:zinc ABC transporter substrate-binding protein [Acidimicrobiales bacterium]
MDRTPCRAGGDRRPTRPVLGACSLLLGVVLAACSTGPASPSPGPNGTVSVVAAENFWGSIAKQVGGSRVTVTSIITNPNSDPHAYEPTARDGRTVSTAQLVIENGIGYDPWMDRLLAATAAPGRFELDVGRLVGVPDGGNPHRWYDPDNVHSVIAQIAADYIRIDPRDAAYFRRQRQRFETQGLARYDGLVRDIRATYAGTPIGASESIVTPLADALGLRMLTPESFLDAISEGTEPTAADKATIDRQIRQRQIKIYVYNSQNATPDVTAQVDEARAHGIPVTTVTETLAPASATFEQWQVTELRGIEAALSRATGH